MLIHIWLHKTRLKKTTVIALICVGMTFWYFWCVLELVELIYKTIKRHVIFLGLDGLKNNIKII